MFKVLNTREVITKKSSNPTATVIWMHGLGASSSDFIPMVSQLDLCGCPSIRFVFPEAPRMPITINNGVVMPAWYDLLSMNIGSSASDCEDEASLSTSQSCIAHLIDQEVRRGIPAHRIVLAGFSQGGAMSLHVGLRYPSPLAGLLCLSGYLPLLNKVVLARHLANVKIPIFQAHGILDPIVPFAAAQQSRHVLEELGYAVAWHEYPTMLHFVCEEEIRDVGAWLRQIF